MSPEIQEVVVVVRHGGRIRWFRSDRDLWVLDTNKWRNEFIDCGYEVPEFNDLFRFGMRVVDQSNAQEFLKCMSGFEVTRDSLSLELAKQFPAAESWWDVQHTFPIMFVDFDERVVSAFYPDGVRMERYIPDGWKGEFCDFANEYTEERFPKREKFWIKGDQDLLAMLNARAARKSRGG